MTQSLATHLHEARPLRRVFHLCKTPYPGYHECKRVSVCVLVFEEGRFQICRAKKMVGRGGFEPAYLSLMRGLLIPDELAAQKRKKPPGLTSGFLSKPLSLRGWSTSHEAK